MYLGITERGARLVRVIKAIQLFRAAAGETLEKFI